MSHAPPPSLSSGTSVRDTPGCAKAESSASIKPPRDACRAKLHQTTSCIAAGASPISTASAGPERPAGAATNAPLTEHYARANAGTESDTVAGSERSASAHSSAESAIAPSAPERPSADVADLVEVPHSWALPVVGDGTCPFIQNVTAARPVHAEYESNPSIRHELGPTVVREPGDVILLEQKLARHMSLRQRMAKRCLGKLQSTLTLAEAYGFPSVSSCEGYSGSDTEGHDSQSDAGRLNRFDRRPDPT